jgi:hypothetical protein
VKLGKDITYQSIAEVYSPDGSIGTPSLSTLFEMSNVERIEATQIHTDHCAMSLPYRARVSDLKYASISRN